MRESNINEQELIENPKLRTETEWAKYFGVSRTVIQRLKKKYNLQTKKSRRPQSKETREKISRKRKEYLKNNPDKHPWRNKDKFKSEPCENAKKILKELGVQFAEEFSPKIDGRFFSIDIAIPDKKIAIEINGNQHYQKNGSLKPYYQERHDLLEKNGWFVFEVHYSCCFNKEQWEFFAGKILSSETIEEFDYFNYEPRKKKPTHNECPNCKINKKTYKSKYCRSCANKIYKRKQKIQWPTKQEMEILIWEKPMTKLSKELGVSDVAINKFCKKLNIETPPIGYWSKKINGRDRWI